MAIRGSQDRGLNYSAPTVEDVARLGADGDISGLEELLSLPAVRRDSILRQAILSQAEAGDAAYVPLLGALLAEDSERLIRFAAAARLGEVGTSSALGPLHDALSDSEETVRARAAQGIGEIADPSSALALADALDDPEWVVRTQAAEALGTTRDPGAIEPLA